MGILRESRTHVRGTGIRRVQVRVSQKLPTGHPCPSLSGIWNNNLLMMAFISKLWELLLVLWGPVSRLEKDRDQTVTETVQNQK